MPRSLSRSMERNPGLPPRILPSSVRTGILLFVMAVPPWRRCILEAATRAEAIRAEDIPGRLPRRPEPDHIPGIPVPGRSSKNKTPAPNQNGPLPNFRGNLKVFDDKTLSVELGDKRVMDFRRTEKTKFFKAGDEVKTPNFNVGDQVSVEAQTDPGGQSMTAVNVYWEKAGGSPSTSSKSDDGVVDTWKDDPKPGPSTAPQGRAGSGHRGCRAAAIAAPTATQARRRSAAIRTTPVRRS